MTDQAKIKESLAAEIGRQMGIVAPSMEPDEDDQIENIMQLAQRLKPMPEKKEEQKGFEFEADFQTRVASLTIFDEQFYRRTDGLIKPEYFQSLAEATLVHIAQQYHARYKRLPMGGTEWKELLKDAEKDRVIRKDDMGDIIAAFRVLRDGNKARRDETGITAGDYVVDKIAQFARNQAVQNRGQV